MECLLNIGHYSRLFKNVYHMQKTSKAVHVMILAIKIILVFHVPTQVQAVYGEKLVLYEFTYEQQFKSNQNVIITHCLHRRLTEYSVSIFLGRRVT